MILLEVARVFISYFYITNQLLPKANTVFGPGLDEGTMLNPQKVDSVFFVGPIWVPITMNVHLAVSRFIAVIFTPSVFKKTSKNYP